MKKIFTFLAVFVMSINTWAGYNVKITITNIPKEYEGWTPVLAWFDQSDEEIPSFDLVVDTKILTTNAYFSAYQVTSYTELYEYWNKKLTSYVGNPVENNTALLKVPAYKTYINALVMLVKDGLACGHKYVDFQIGNMEPVDKTVSFAMTATTPTASGVLPTDGATSVSNVASDAKNKPFSKVVKNGDMLIINNGRQYNSAGMREK